MQSKQFCYFRIHIDDNTLGVPQDFTWHRLIEHKIFLFPNLFPVKKNRKKVRFKVELSVASFLSREHIFHDKKIFIQPKGFFTTIFFEFFAILAVLSDSSYSCQIDIKRESCTLATMVQEKFWCRRSSLDKLGISPIKFVINLLVYITEMIIDTYIIYLKLNK